MDIQPIINNHLTDRPNKGFIPIDRESAGALISFLMLKQIPSFRVRLVNCLTNGVINSNVEVSSIGMSNEYRTPYIQLSGLPEDIQHILLIKYVDGKYFEVQAARERKRIEPVNLAELENKYAKISEKQLKENNTEDNSYTESVLEEETIKVLKDNTNKIKVGMNHQEGSSQIQGGIIEWGKNNEFKPIPFEDANKNIDKKPENKKTKLKAEAMEKVFEIQNQLTNLIKELNEADDA